MATQLVPLPQVEKLSASVIRILAGNPGKYTLQGTNTYLVGRGPQRLLIDTGEGKPAWAQALKSVLAAEKATVKQALLTHWHHDHVMGVSDLREICPDVKIYKHDPDDDQLEIKDGQVFKVEGATLTAFYTPGHTADHMAFLFEEEDAMFTGDNILGQGTAVFEDLIAYLSSLEKMYSRARGRGYTGHGPVVEDCKGKIMEYLKHRQQRENEVLRVLTYGTLNDSGNSEQSSSRTWAPIDIVKVIYKDIPKELHLSASHGVNQVLMKLEADGRVTYDTHAGGWKLNAQRPAL
ncbi:hypothetical protein VTO42DRAFT_7543 [Malbranchea cinnamomea]